MVVVVLGIILTLCTVVLIFRGPVAALGTGCLISLLFPSWLKLEVLSESIDLRLATSATLLLVNVCHPRRRINWAFNGTDWCVFTLYFIHIVSDFWQDGLQPINFAKALFEWSIPYVSGRLAIQNPEDWRWLTRVAMVVVTIFAIGSTTEAVTQVNISSTVFGKRPADRTPYHMMRAGLKRAEGPTIHPIWLGMVQVLLLPWVISGCFRAFRYDGSMWWMAVPLASICGIASTVSRGPILAAILVYYLTAALCSLNARKILIPLGFVALIFGFFAKDEIEAQVNDWGAKNWNATLFDRQVELDGKLHTLTNVSVRRLMFKAYEPAIRQAGLLGFGSERTSTFPINVPLGSDAKNAIKEFWTIDCEYLLLLLRFGWLGVLTFTLVGIFSTWNILHQSQFVSGQEKLFPYAVAATLIAALLTLAVEWMPHDYGYLYLWLCGVANGPRLTRTEQPAPIRKPRVVRFRSDPDLGM